MEEEIEASMKFLHQKTTDYNKTLDCVIGGSGLRFTADIPLVESEFKMVEKYQRWNILDSGVQFRNKEGKVIFSETKLFGILVVYALAEIKLVLYSAVKSKVSEAVLQLLEIMRPLNYVNPVLLTTLKDDH